MKNKTMLRFLLCFLIIGIFVGACCTYAAGPSDKPFFQKGSGMFNTGKNVVNSNMDPILHIQSLMMMLGVFSAVIVTGIFAIQWFTANPGKKQELKSGIWPLTIGVVLLSIGPKFGFAIYNALKPNTTGTLNSRIDTLGGTIISVIRNVGYAAAVIMVLVLAIQWFAATPNKRQELKSKMWNIVIGVVLLVSGSTILGLISEVVKKAYG